jgi:aspartokinase
MLNWRRLVKVLQTRSVELAMRYKAAFSVLSSFEEQSDDAGTLVRAGGRNHGIQCGRRRRVASSLVATRQNDADFLVADRPELPLRFRLCLWA